MGAPLPLHSPSVWGIHPTAVSSSIHPLAWGQLNPAWQKSLFWVNGCDSPALGGAPCVALGLQPPTIGFSWELIAPQSLPHSGRLLWLCFPLAMVMAASSSSGRAWQLCLACTPMVGGRSGRDREDLLQIAMPCQKQSVYIVSTQRIPPCSVLNRPYPISAGTETPFCSPGGVVTARDISMISSQGSSPKLTRAPLSNPHPQKCPRILQAHPLLFLQRSPLLT